MRFHTMSPLTHRMGASELPSCNERVGWEATLTIRSTLCVSPSPTRKNPDSQTPSPSVDHPTGLLRAAYDRIRQLDKLAHRHQRKLRDAQHEVRKVQAALRRSEIEVDSMTSSFNDRKKAMEDRDEIEEPWRKLTEREPSMEHHVEHQFIMLEQELHKLQAYATSCEERIVELEERILQIDSRARLVNWCSTRCSNASTAS